MTDTVISLLVRNLHGVFGEADDVRRGALAGELFTEDALFVEPAGITCGRAAIAGKIPATHPSFAYAELAPAENLHGLAGRLRWTSGEPGRPRPMRVPTSSSSRTAVSQRSTCSSIRCSENVTRHGLLMTMTPRSLADAPHHQ